LPLVGDGREFASLDVQVLGTRERMPSHGFVSGNLTYVLRDLGAGWLKKYWDNGRILNREGHQGALVVCVGDVFLVLTAALFLRGTRVLFAATAKSDYISEHWAVEKFLMRRYCSEVFARDANTAYSLVRSGVPATYVGNVLMDCLHFTGETFGITEGIPVIGILPGSKPEAYRHLETILGAVTQIHRHEKGRACFLLALASSLDIRNVLSCAPPRENWELVPSSSPPGESGVQFRLISQEGASVLVAVGKFADVLSCSRVVIGTAGMANEQAVGLGRPVVTFPGEGPQITTRFLKAQQRLLGESLLVVEKSPDALAGQVISIIHNPLQLERIKQAGTKRMGRGGAAFHIASAIHRTLTETANAFP